MTPYSDEWQARANKLLVGVDALDGVRLDGRLQFQVGDRSGWAVVVKHGVVTEIGQCVDQPDVTVVLSREDANSILFGALDGTEAARRCKVSTADREEQLPPNELSDRAELGALPRISGATMTVQYEFAHGPFGDVAHWTEFHDGKVTGMDFGHRSDAEVTVAVPYHAMARVRCGDFTILDAIECGSVEGAMGPLAMLAGIHESPEFHDAELAGGRRAIALAALGEVAATEAFQAAWHALAVESSPDD